MEFHRGIRDVGSGYGVELGADRSKRRAADFAKAGVCWDTIPNEPAGNSCDLGILEIREGETVGLCRTRRAKSVHRSITVADETVLISDNREQCASAADFEISAAQAGISEHLTASFWIAACGFGMLAAWIGRNSINTDGISYLDVASAFNRHDWASAVNAYWSPVYPFLLSLGLKIFRPSIYKEFAVVHLVNFTIFLTAAAACDFFLTRLLRYRKQMAGGANPFAATNSIPDWALLALGYTLFLWTSLKLITLSDVSPDMLVAAFVYLQAGILLGMRHSGARPIDFLLLGGAAGCGYLAKAPMLPMGLIFLGLALLAPAAVGKRRKATILLPIYLAAFLVVAGPFIAALSHFQGRLTWGDSAKLNYAWYVNHVPRYHWQGELKGLGAPIHPTQKLNDTPAIYDFDGHGSATYEAWYDPAYWNDGVKTRIDWKSILPQVLVNRLIYYDVFFAQLAPVLVVCAFLFLIGGRGKLARKDVAAYWIVLLPPLAAFGMYIGVHVEVRMIGAFVVMFWMGLFTAIKFDDSASMRKAGEWAVMALVSFTILTLGFSMLGDAASYSRAELTAWNNTNALPQWQIVNELRRAGIEPGDKVAWIRPNIFDDRTQNYFWARLAQVRIVAEIPAANADDFWNASPDERAKDLDILSSTGAAALVVTKMPLKSPDAGWKPLGKTGYFEYPLRTALPR